MGKGFVSSHLMTLGADFSQKINTLSDGTTVRLQIWDVAGQDSFKKVRTRFLMKTHGVLLIFDITRKDTFANLTRWLQEVWQINQTRKIPLLIIGNKSDLSKTRIVTREMVLEYMKALRLKYIPHSYLAFLETSAKTGKNIEKGFEKITAALLDKVQK